MESPKQFIFKNVFIGIFIIQLFIYKNQVIVYTKMKMIDILLQATLKK